jgi:hypothetical protein
MNNETLILNKAVELIKDQKMFTSVDLANAIKKDGNWIRNIEVASWLRENYRKLDEFLEYKTTPIQVCSNTRSATLYFPEGSNPDLYSNRDQEPLTQVEVDDIRKKKTSVKKSPDKKVTDIVDLLNDSKTVLSAVISSKERIKIPGSMIKKLGYNPGDKIPPDIVKSTYKIPGNLIVNKDCRLSIPRSVVNWGTDPIKVILTNDNKITFEKA